MEQVRRIRKDGQDIHSDGARAAEGFHNLQTAGGFLRFCLDLVVFDLGQSSRELSRSDGVKYRKKASTHVGTEDLAPSVCSARGSGFAKEGEGP